MKRFHIFSFTILATLLMFPMFYAFGHSPCQSEKKTLDSAQRELDDAEAWLGYYELKLAAARRAYQDAATDNDPATIPDWTDVYDAQKAVEEAKEKVKEPKKKRDTARNAFNNCMAHAYRTCGCAVHHTESLTSCSCYYNTWNGWCHCLGS